MKLHLLFFLPSVLSRNEQTAGWNIIYTYLKWSCNSHSATSFHFMRAEVTYFRCFKIELYARRSPCEDNYSNTKWFNLFRDDGLFMWNWLVKLVICQYKAFKVSFSEIFILFSSVFFWKKTVDVVCSWIVSQWFSKIFKIIFFGERPISKDSSNCVI